MLPEILSGCFLIGLTVVIHACGLGMLLKLLQKSRTILPGEVWPGIRRLVFVAWGLILIHLLAIAVWALFYWWQGCMPDAESAFYFSGVTYATLGYGDLVLADDWRMLGPIEGLMGGLMVGLSTGFFFAMMSKIYGSQMKLE